MRSHSSGCRPAQLLPKLIVPLFAVIVVLLVIRVQRDDTEALRRQVESMQVAMSVHVRRAKVHQRNAPSEMDLMPQVTNGSSRKDQVTTQASSLPPVHQGHPKAPTGIPNRASLSAELAEAALQHLFFQRGELQTFRAEFESRERAQCRLTCNEHGLSVRIPDMTEGCECVCSGGWAGASCHVPPRGIDADTLAPPIDDIVLPDVQIPLDRDELPAPPHEAAADQLERCRSASVSYFKEHGERGEFRSDRAIDHFWRIASQLILPYCSTYEERVAIVDVGAHVGTRLGLWHDALLKPGLEYRCGGGGPIVNDSLVLLVEPNPLNLLPLRRAVAALQQSPGMQPSQGMNASSVRPTLRGSIVVEDVAAAHFDGDGVLVVDLTANRNQKKDGNERGYLRPVSGRGGNASSLQGTSKRRPRSTSAPHLLRQVRTTVRTVSSLVKDVVQRSASLSVRPITTISVLKVDAEGLDAIVLYGAHDVLPMTKLVVFECHRLWKERGQAHDSTRSDHNSGEVWWRLREAVTFLAKHGFESYMVGQYYWVPLTPPHYWDDVYEERLEWSNCIAVRKGHPIMRAFSLPPPCSSAI